MGNSAKAVTDATSSGKQPVTFQEQVNEATKQLVRDDKGHWEFPTDAKLDESVKYAAVSEARRRAAQSKLAKTSTKLSIAEEKNTSLTNLVKQGGTLQLSVDEEAVLQELKFSDPEEWRAKMNELELGVTAKTTELLSSIDTEAIAKGSIGDREVILSNFLQDNPKLTITDEVIANDVPPRITKKLESGDITFLEYLTEVGSYLTTGKVVQGIAGTTDPNLTKIGGSGKPSDEAVGAETETTYSNAVF